MTRTLLVLNGLFIVLMIWIIFSITRVTHEVSVNQLLGFAPPLTTWFALAHRRNRSLGGIAVLINGLLLVGGAFTLLAALMSAGNHGTVSDQLAIPALGVFLFTVGYFNFRAVWTAFPARNAAAQDGA